MRKTVMFLLPCLFVAAPAISEKAAEPDGYKCSFVHVVDRFNDETCFGDKHASIAKAKDSAKMKCAEKKGFTESLCYEAIPMDESGEHNILISPAS